MYRTVAMRDARRLFVIVGQAALIVTGAYLALVLVTLKFALTPGEEEIEGAMMAIVPVGVAAWWIFRKLQAHHPRREARAAAIVFAVFTPMALLMALLVAQIFGGYSGVLFGNPLAFPGALVGIVILVSIVSFVPVVFTLWIIRRKSG